MDFRLILSYFLIFFLIIFSWCDVWDVSLTEISSCMKALIKKDKKKWNTCEWFNLLLKSTKLN